MPVEVLREMQRRLPQVRLWNFYGQTEIAPLATVLKPEDQLRKPGSAGRPALNVETRVVDDQMRDVKIGEIGEIVHRSPQLLSGYYKDPERTAAAFEGGWFHSGDLAVVDADGYISVVDRKKDMIKSGGENVASREVEETIYGLPQVSEVAVIGLPHARWVEAVTAVIVAKQGQTLTEREVVDYCSRKLGGLQGAQGRRLRRGAAEEPERQAAQARAAHAAGKTLRELKSPRKKTWEHVPKTSPSRGRSAPQVATPRLTRVDRIAIADVRPEVPVARGPPAALATWLPEAAPARRPAARSYRWATACGA